MEPLKTATLLLGLCALAHAQGLRILVDKPGRLEIEMTLPDTGLQARASSDGMRIACERCASEAIAGAPDLPVAGFTVLSGSKEPQIRIIILASVTRTVPEGIAPVGASVTPTFTRYVRDPELYRAAVAPAARIGALQFLRGAPVRNLRIPLALWSETDKVLTTLKRIRVEMDFPGARSQSARSQLQGSFRDQVANPIGGAYLYASGSPSALRKASAATPALGDTLIRISIGDRNLENLDEDRVYTVAYRDLAVLAPTLQGIPIRNLRLYAGPNDTLARVVAGGAPLPGTLAEIPIEVGDNNGNGVFDDHDSLSFYGHGTSVWKRQAALPAPIRFAFSADPYSFENRYYLDFSGRPGGAALRWRDGRPFASPGSNPAAALTAAYHYLRAEKDAVAFGCSPDYPRAPDSANGYWWFWHWNGTCNNQPAVTLGRSDLASAETETLKDAANPSGDSLFLGLNALTNTAHDDFRAWIPGAPEPMAYLDGPEGLGNWYVTKAALPESRAFHIDSLQWGGQDRRFDGYTVVYRRKLSLQPAAGAAGVAPLWISPPQGGRQLAYRVENGAGAACLRIENGIAVAKVGLDGNGVFSDSIADGCDVRYLVYRQAASLPMNAMELELLPPAGGGKGIRDLETGDGKQPQYLIIAPRALADQAVALEKFRNDPKRAFPVSTEIVFVEDIYRQFSGGRMSPPAIRDFLRWAYNSWGGKGPGANPLQYVALFGSGHYDYRNLKSAGGDARHPNHIPPYEFYPDQNQLEGLASDDYYALLDSGEVVGGKSQLDLSVGRIPARAAADAEAYLKKLAEYEDPTKAGVWRGRAIFAADDGTQRTPTGEFDPIPTGHTNPSESLVKAIEGNDPGLTSDKVYLLDYRMNSAYHKPEASQDLLSLINRGGFLVNFVGHGSRNQWADEVLLQTNDALARMQNQGRTPMINAFSCTVGRFDDLKNYGMSEQFVMARDKGAIAAVSALRESFPAQNIALASAFYLRAVPPVGNGKAEPLGEALMQAKNSESGLEYHNNSRYALLGEPVLLLRKPPLAVSISRAPDTLKALDCDTISGRIEGGSGSGIVNVKILAGTISKVWPTPKGSGVVTQYAQERGGILFERTLAYKDHRFATDYFIPRQISFGDTNARILAFAWDGTREAEGSAAINGLSIKGQSAGACAVDSDGKGPKISITGCESKETGAVDFPDHVKLSLPNCLEIQVVDSTGGVLSAQGPDEGTTVEIPGVMDPFHPHPGIDELDRKVFRLPLEASTVPVGMHLLKVSARDGYGNFTSRTLRMELGLDSSVQTVTAYNFPNPMKREGTIFHFSTVLPSRSVNYDDPVSGTDRLDFSIRIYNQSGMLVRVFERAQSGVTGWDGRDQWGNLAANGVYFYNITARQSFADPGIRPDYRTVSSKRNILVLSR